MKIIYKNGDVLDASETYIAHGCNCQGKMGKGVALEIRKKFPKAYDEYINRFETEGLHLGSIIIVSVGTPLEEKYIINCLTQFTYSSNPDIMNISYNALRASMRKINLFFKDKEGVNEVAMPTIGASLGGGDWKTISQIIEEESKFFQPIVYIKEGKNET